MKRIIILIIYLTVYNTYANDFVDIDFVVQSNFVELGFNIEIIENKTDKNHYLVNIKSEPKNKNGNDNSSTVFLKDKGKTILEFKPNITIKNGDNHFSFQVAKEKIQDIQIYVGHEPIYIINLNDFIKKE